MDANSVEFIAEKRNAVRDLAKGLDRSFER
jgi:hypothetical protein